MQGDLLSAFYILYLLKLNIYAMKKFIIALITSISDEELVELIHYAELECELRMNAAEHEPEPCWETGLPF